MMVEAGVVVGYGIAWVVRKVRRAAGRLDAEVNAVVDGSLDRLHDMVAAKLGLDPAWKDLRDEAATDEQVSDLTRQRVELAIQAAAAKDAEFTKAVTDLVTQLRAAEGPTAVGAGSTAIAGDVDVHAESGSVAAWNITGGVHLGTPPPDPSAPGRSRG
ncbi:hypothetical protein [Amycolatopsis sp. cmx-8-4]|uniref:hypothetical protein n=1 Tax=Amycolatopsis sp. cmx-8-4 TaxID=2790947 RepID=UPI00397AE041